MKEPAFQVYKVVRVVDDVLDDRGPFWYWSGHDMCDILHRIATHYHRATNEFAIYDHVVKRYMVLRQGQLITLTPMNHDNPE